MAKLAMPGLRYSRQAGAIFPVNQVHRSGTGGKGSGKGRKLGRGEEGSSPSAAVTVFGAKRHIFHRKAGPYP